MPGGSAGRGGPPGEGDDRSGWSGRVRRAVRRSGAGRRTSDTRPRRSRTRITAADGRPAPGRHRACAGGVGVVEVVPALVGGEQRRRPPRVRGVRAYAAGCGTVPGDEPPVDTGGGAGPPPACLMPSVPSAYSPVRKGGVTVGHRHRRGGVPRSPCRRRALPCSLTAASSARRRRPAATSVAAGPRQLWTDTAVISRRHAQGEQRHVVGAAGRHAGGDSAAQRVQRFEGEGEGVPAQPVRTPVEVAARCLDESVGVQRQGGAGLRGCGVRPARSGDRTGAEERSSAGFRGARRAAVTEGGRTPRGQAGSSGPDREHPMGVRRLHERRGPGGRVTSFLANRPVRRRLGLPGRPATEKHWSPVGRRLVPRCSPWFPARSGTRPARPLRPEPRQEGR